MKNKLIDVHNSLMASLEALDDDTMTEEELASELKKIKAKTEIAKEIVELNRLAFDTFKYQDTLNIPQNEVPEQFRIGVRK